jgi:hypothetical protein
VEGACAARLNERHQLVGIRIYTPWRKTVTVLDESGAKLSGAPGTIAALMRYSNRGGQRRPIRGAVTLVESLRAVYVQDANAGVKAVSNMPVNVAMRITAEPR